MQKIKFEIIYEFKKYTFIFELNEQKINIEEEMNGMIKNITNINHNIIDREIENSLFLIGHRINEYSQLEKYLELIYEKDNFWKNAVEKYQPTDIVYSSNETIIEFVEYIGDVDYYYLVSMDGCGGVQTYEWDDDWGATYNICKMVKKDNVKKFKIVCQTTCWFFDDAETLKRRTTGMFDIVNFKILKNGAIESDYEFEKEEDNLLVIPTFNPYLNENFSLENGFKILQNIDSLNNQEDVEKIIKKEILL
jgi:hypothetical protein